MYFKATYNNYIIGVGVGNRGNEINEKDYNSLTAILRQRPTATDGYAYMLRADTLEWEPVPEESDPTADDIINTLFGGGVE